MIITHIEVCFYYCNRFPGFPDWVKKITIKSFFNVTLCGQHVFHVCYAGVQHCSDTVSIHVLLYPHKF